MRLEGLTASRSTLLSDRRRREEPGIPGIVILTWPCRPRTNRREPRTMLTHLLPAKVVRWTLGSPAPHILPLPSDVAQLEREPDVPAAVRSRPAFVELRVRQGRVGYAWLNILCGDRGVGMSASCPLLVWSHVRSEASSGPYVHPIEQLRPGWLVAGGPRKAAWRSAPPVPPCSPHGRISGPISVCQLFRMASNIESHVPAETRCSMPPGSGERA